MNSLPPSSKYVQHAGAPVDDLEREALTARLSDAFADGRVEQDDYMAALDQVYAASTLGELVPVIEQLPAPAVAVPAIVSTGVAPAGQMNPSRNVLIPALVATGTVLVLLVILAVVIGMFIVPL